MSREKQPTKNFNHISMLYQKFQKENPGNAQTTPQLSDKDTAELLSTAVSESLELDKKNNWQTGQDVNPTSQEVA
ncbi:MAG: hypothetical protein F6K59_33625 [Moorea sp. SIO3F7]|nr:hypothetical protein [Moorena sp. SIO3E8]NEQ03611.1 hypothetical protein [Moorena sp. SIO3F7]